MEIDSKNEIIAYRRQKAHELLNEVQLLIDNKLWNSAVSRMYYACFHVVSALLINSHGCCVPCAEARPG